MHATKKQEKILLTSEKDTTKKRSCSCPGISFSFFDEKRSHPISNGEARFGIANDVTGFGIADDVAGFGIADDVAGFGIADNFEDIAHDDERILTNNSAPARRVRRGGS